MDFDKPYDVTIQFNIIFAVDMFLWCLYLSQDFFQVHKDESLPVTINCKLRSVLGTHGNWVIKSS